jgi:hypothetical protein
MADVRVRNKKTGEEREMPEKAANLLAHVWARVGEVETTEVKKSLKQNDDAPPVPAEFKQAVEVKDGEVTDLNADTETGLDLAKEYEILSGKKPDSRWSVKTLQTKLNELKGV